MHLDGKILAVTGECTAKISPSKILCYMVVAMGYIMAKVCTYKVDLHIICTYDVRCHLKTF